MDKLWTPEELAEYFHTTVGQLANERTAGRGPRFVKRGRKILYRGSDIQRYLEDNTVSSTKQQATAP
ncbi:helix-turn-helix domain-containing protein [Nocardia terpenica]|nr:helix-turn-helix domain-containing protein [Nocardia terpenica]MBF6060568.1 helix-turn-helix domain-containing protein [Nocardia terpenica]MBF6103828.1 helix-turn-helix domain-containing protein [Nocardia terpenica]MBF6111798.1 helix-turn-helix domain-containing protein [Nocardia terpenica]MBF6118049.1 helix-turn-helix domain-containing protein [Nocardia terpenica]MBF6155225.1 helix-turn-helix domain-containing protein [Nocardia terpenica]